LSVNLAGLVGIDGIKCSINLGGFSIQAQEFPGLVELRSLEDATVVIVELGERLVQDAVDLFFSEKVAWVLSHGAHHLADESAHFLAHLLLHRFHSRSESGVILLTLINVVGCGSLICLETSQEAGGLLQQVVEDFKICECAEFHCLFAHERECEFSPFNLSRSINIDTVPDSLDLLFVVSSSKEFPGFNIFFVLKFC